MTYLNDPMIAAAIVITASTAIPPILEASWLQRGTSTSKVALRLPEGR